VRLRAIGPDGTVREVPVAGRVVIGRSGETDLVLAGERVSRRHASVEVRGGRVVVEDLGSSNGTWIGGTRITGAAVVDPGAEVRIGGWTVAMEAGGDETVALPAPGMGGRGGAHREGPGLPARRARRRPAVVAAGAAVVAAMVVLGWAMAAGEGGSAAGAASAGTAAGGELRATGTNTGAEAAHAGAALGTVPARVSPGAEPARAGATPGTPAVQASAGAAKRLDRWRAEVAGAKHLLAERRTAGDWAGAREALERLAALDPLEPAVPAAREALAAEERAAGLESKAGELAALGRDEEALSLYLQIPRSSWHHGRARDAAARVLRERLVPARRQACVEGLSRGSPTKALPECRRYLDLTCHERPDEGVVKAVRRLERSRREEPWSCPRELAAWLSPGSPAARDDGHGRAVRARYPEAAVAEALLAHFREGRTRAAREALERIVADAVRSGGDPSAGGTARGLALRLGELDGRLVEVRAKVLAGELDAAEGALARAAAIEAEILPGGPVSRALLAGRAALAAAHRERGEEHLALGREGLAFAALEKALALDPADAAARRGIERLEARAASRLARNPSCEEARAALAITTAGGATHRRAEERLAGSACRDVGGF
jgi:tetratricopeptide (TPR) repeat protein